MSFGLIYHSSEPESKKDVYTEHTNLDFNINVGEGRVLVKNSVKLVGDIRVLDNAARNATDIYFDHVCGAHSFIDSVQVQFIDGPNAGSKENCQNYARFVSMSEQAMKCPEDAFSKSSVMELKSADERGSIIYSKGRTTINTGAKVTLDQDFAIAPHCILNRMAGDHLPYSKSGVIRFTANLAPNRSALMGAAYNQAQDSYEIRNPRVLFQSIPDDGKQKQSVMRSIYNVKNSILSNFSNVQARVPAVCDAVSISFQRQSREQAAPFSNYQCEEPRALDEIQFLFNDSTNEFISYVISDQTEMLDRYIESFNVTGHNRIAGSKYKDNRSFGVGLPFNQPVDLSNQKFSLQVKSGASNVLPYNCYMYFHSIMVM